MRRLIFIFLIFTVIISPVFADEVEQADDFQEFIQESSTDIEDISFSVDKETGEINGDDFESIFGEEFDENSAEDVIKDSDYQILDESSDEYIVASAYATNRIMVTEEVQDLNGAESGVTYNGDTILTYSDEESTKEGYENLVEIYGEENVIPDVPLKADAFGWGTEFMNLDAKMKELASSGKSVTVAVLDTGINKNHIIFSGKSITGTNIIGSGTSYADDNEHGTMVAGIIAESTPQNVKLLILKVMNSKGQTTMLTYLNGVEYAASNGADIINSSLGGEIDSSATTAIDKKLKAAIDKGCIVTCAVGNEGANMDKGVFYPAESPYTYAVGGVSSDGGKISFSNYGSNLDFVAPGKSIIVADYSSNTGLATVSGTSMACPYISSCAALIRSEKGKLNYQKLKTELINMCVDYGTSGKDVYYGYGLPKFKVKKSISGKTVKLGYTTTTYSGAEKKPSVSISGLKKGTDFTVTYKNNINVGTATVTINGIGDYKDSKTENFKITAKQITPTIVLSKDLFYYDKTAKKPTVTVKDGTKTLASGNYTVTFPKNPVETGTYTIKVTLKNNYSGENTATYRIAKHKKYVVITKNGRFYKLIEQSW